MKWIQILLCLLLVIPKGKGQAYDEPKSIGLLLQELKHESVLQERIALLNRISFAYSLIFRTDSSIYYASQVLLLAEENSLSKGVARAHYNIGLSLQRMGAYADAVQEFEITRRLAEQEQNRQLVADARYSVGHSYYMMRVYEKALVMHQGTLEYLKKHRLTGPLPMIYNALGLVCMGQEKLDVAHHYFLLALQTAKQYRQELFQMVASKNIGRVFLRMGKDEEGVRYLWRSIEIADSSKVLHTKNGAVLSYECLAEYENGRGNYRKGVTYATQALTVALKYNSTEDVYDVSGVLYQSYKGLGDFPNALEALELNQRTYEQMHDRLEKTNQKALENRLQMIKQKSDINELQNEKKRKALTEFWMIIGLIIIGAVAIWLFWLYRLMGKQKKEIDRANLLLHQKVIQRTDELENAYHEVENALTKGQTIERKRIAADIHDNLGGVLSSVFIGMEMIDQTSLSSSERQIFANIKNQVSMAYDEIRMLSHNLRPDIIEKEGLKIALLQMSQRITLIHKIHVHLDVQYVSILTKTIEHNLYAVVMELLNNVIKHAMASEIWVSIFESEDRSLEVRVEDNGLGFDQKSIDKSTGTGLLNISERLTQIKGQMEYKSEAGRTLFLIKIA